MDGAVCASALAAAALKLICLVRTRMESGTQVSDASEPPAPGLCTRRWSVMSVIPHGVSCPRRRWQTQQDEASSHTSHKHLCFNIAGGPPHHPRIQALLSPQGAAWPSWHSHLTRGGEGQPPPRVGAVLAESMGLGATYLLGLNLSHKRRIPVD